jgi:hypothetical protein
MTRSLGRQRSWTVDGGHVADDANTITIHNHLPYAGRDGDYHSVEPSRRGSDGEEEPPEWFASHKAETEDRFRVLNAALGEIASGLRQFFSQEGEEGDEPDERSGDEMSEGGMKQFASGLVPPSAVAKSTRSASGPPRNVSPRSEEAHEPLWKNSAHEPLTETSGKALDRTRRHTSDQSGLFTPAAINARALQLRKSRPTW